MLRTTPEGLSLVEAMIALVVVMTGLIGVVQLFPQGLATSRHSRERTQATLLAKGQLNALRLEGFDAIADAQRFGSGPEPFLDSQQEVVSLQFRWQAEVIRLAGDLLEVHLRVVWPWPQQRYQVNLATYVSKH
jgi:Tfp pilus assembly protein PilV